MKKFLSSIAIIGLIVTEPAQAQIGFGGMFPGPGTVHSAGASYTGPTDTLATVVEYWGLDANSSAYRGSKAINLCNVADVVCADVNTDATTGLVPNTDVIGGVTCGTTVGVNICTIKKYYGQLGVADQVQNTIANRHVFTPSGIGSNPSGTGTVASFYTSSANIALASQPFTYIGAAERTGNTSTATNFIACFGVSTAVFNHTNAANTVDAFAGNDVTETASDNSFHTLIAIFNGASSTIAVDGTQNGGINLGSNGSSAGQSCYIAGSSNSTGLTGQFLGGGIWSTAPSSGNMTTINTNYHSRWGY